MKTCNSCAWWNTVNRKEDMCCGNGLARIDAGFGSEFQWSPNPNVFFCHRWEEPSFHPPATCLHCGVSLEESCLEITCPDYLEITWNEVTLTLCEHCAAAEILRLRRIAEERRG